jgi:2'-5' RNA ligase
MRLFYGIPLGEAAKAALASELAELAKSRTRMSLTKRENLHITLLFLGEQQDATKFIEALDAVPKGAFSIAITGFGAFPSAERARVVWAGVSPEERVINIHEVICGKLGTREPEYKPHVTLARLKDRPDGVVDKLLAKKTGIHVEVSCVQLLESTLSPEGPEYKVLHEVRL